MRFSRAWVGQTTSIWTALLSVFEIDGLLLFRRFANRFVQFQIQDGGQAPDF